MSDTLFTSLISGGGCLALAFAVWLQQRDQTKELRGIRISLARILQAVGIVEDDTGDTAPPPYQIRRRTGTPVSGVPRAVTATEYSKRFRRDDE